MSADMNVVPQVIGAVQRLVDAAGMHESGEIRKILGSWSDKDGDADLKSKAINWAMEKATERSRVGSSVRGHRVSERLVQACADALIDTVDVLLAAGAHLNFVGSEGLAPLHAAIVEGNPAFATQLLDRGAQVDFPDAEGKTALRHCVARGNFKAARSMLRAGADPNHRPAGEREMSDMAIFGSFGAGVDWLLLAYGAKVRSDQIRISMTEAAARARDHERVAELLSEQGPLAAKKATELRKYVLDTMGSEPAGVNELVDLIGAKATIAAAAASAQSRREP